jgi:hypothetical protein
VNAEAEVLVCCSRTDADQHVLDRLRVLCERNLDWAYLLQQASFHGVMPLLCSNLRKAGMEGVPRHVADSLGHHTRANVRHSLFLTAELVRLTKRFDAAGIPAIPFKGPVLAASAYGDVTLRHFSDLDILVHKSDIPAAGRLMLSLGYRSQWPAPEADRDHAAFRTPNHYIFLRPDGLSRVDLQWRVAEPYFSFSLDRDQLWGGLMPIALPGRTVYSFEPTNMLLVLCIHGSKHRWEKLKWVCDVSEVLRRYGSVIDWQTFQRNASRFRAERMAGLGLLLAQDVLGADIPVPISRRLGTSIQTLACSTRATLFGMPGPAPAARKRITFYLRATDHWQDRASFGLRYVYEWVLAIFTPSSIDAAMLPLPKHLSFLYYCFRPVRLLVKYARLAVHPSDHRKAPSDA